MHRIQSGSNPMHLLPLSRLQMRLRSKTKRSSHHEGHEEHEGRASSADYADYTDGVPSSGFRKVSPETPKRKPFVWFVVDFSCEMCG
jgi:hypothetical protein